MTSSNLHKACILPDLRSIHSKCKLLLYSVSTYCHHKYKLLTIFILNLHFALGNGFFEWFCKLSEKFCHNIGGIFLTLNNVFVGVMVAKDTSYGRRVGGEECDVKFFGK